MPGLRTPPYTDLPAPAGIRGQRGPPRNVWSGAPQSDARLPRTFPPAVPSDSPFLETQTPEWIVRCAGRQRLMAGTDDRRRECPVSAAQRQDPSDRSASGSRPFDNPSAQRRFSAPRCRRSDRAQTPCLSGPAASPSLCPRSCGRQARPLVPGGVIGQLVLEGDLRLCRQRPIADLCHRRSAKTPQGYWAAALLRRADALASATSRFGSAFPGNVAHPAFITKSVWS